MKYISTRADAGSAEALEFEDVLLAGLARDGGLFVPEVWPTIDAETLRSWRSKPYADIAFEVMRLFVDGTIPDDDLHAICRDAYASFDTELVAPLVQYGPNDWIMELYHGPTLAFKDVAMQMLGRLFDYVLEKRDERVTIVGATSGDTGSAAIEAFRGLNRVSITILHPHNRTSEVQRRQMTTVLDENVQNLAIEGTFDDCQALVKAMFNDLEFRDELKLSGVNSINWARIMPQIVYYITSALALGAPDREIAYTVPTGNFGDIFAGYIARQMGLPISQLVVATNINDILTRTLETGCYSVGEVHQTISPSMDIQVSSNFERLLYDIHDRDGAAVRSMMEDLAEKGSFTISENGLKQARELFSATRVDESTTKITISELHKRTGLLMDTHTAVGLAAAASQRRDTQTPMVVLSTAHPAKFPEAVEEASGIKPDLPVRMQDIFEREERFLVTPNDLSAVQSAVRLNAQ